MKRPPDLIIGDPQNPYMLRWWLIPRNRFGFNIYLHKFLRSDDDRALHCHPWWSMGMILRGKYIEHMPADPAAWRNGDRRTIQRTRRAWRPVFRSARHIHRVELYIPKPENFYGPKEPVWTIFITGKPVREWGFWCPQGFRKSDDFLERGEGTSVIGRGCE